MKIQGKQLQLRGSNHKYWQLDNLDELFETLKAKSIGEFCKETNIPYNSVRYRVERYFTDEMKAAIKRDRKPHKKKKTLVKSL